MHLNKKHIPGVRRNHELCINNFQPNKHFHHRLARSVAMKIQVGLNPYTVHREASVELEWPTTLEGLHGTVQRTCVRVLAIGIRLHLLNLCLHVVKRQTAC